MLRTTEYPHISFLHQGKDQGFLRSSGPVVIYRLLPGELVCLVVGKVRETGAWIPVLHRPLSDTLRRTSERLSPKGDPPP